MKVCDRNENRCQKLVPNFRSGNRRRFSIPCVFGISLVQLLDLTFDVIERCLSITYAELADLYSRWLGTSIMNDWLSYVKARIPRTFDWLNLSNLEFKIMAEIIAQHFVLYDVNCFQCSAYIFPFYSFFYSFIVLHLFYVVFIMLLGFHRIELNCLYCVVLKLGHSGQLQKHLLPCHSLAFLYCCSSSFVYWQLNNNIKICWHFGKLITKCLLIYIKRTVQLILWIVLLLIVCLWCVLCFGSCAWNKTVCIM